ncbi:hypothetical protein [Hyalangium minutum]|uniref:Uncharacterized protein n=1 Tax=Hyalangium minutum TaxID=394096 RepID=A0A085WIX2_9BACT|nr:hypothetical protein [Hyalangium minutum]KFE67635.1 hypothetical protein DB31_8118 [Hyalangium minutum]
MSSIRRILSGISTATTWAARLEVTAPIRHQPTAPVEPVARRGFSDQSDFQSSQEAGHSLLEAHAPSLAGRARKSSDPMSTYTGHSDFQARLPRYQHLLGTNVPPPPARYWEAWRARTGGAASPQASQARQEEMSGNRPGVSATADLEKSFELAGEDDSVLLYAPSEGESGRSVVQHADGSVTDPENPEQRFPDAQAWESEHPELKRAMTLSRDDLELVLAMPEGEARNEVLSELANPEPFEGSDSGGAGIDAFMPSLDDLPMGQDSAQEASAASDGFMPSLDDLPGGVKPAPQEFVDSEAPLSSTGELTEGQSPLEVAGQVARQGTSELQAQVATALYEKSLAPEVSDATGLKRGAALAASGSPQAAQALLQRIGEGNLADFVRSVMQA